MHDGRRVAMTRPVTSRNDTRTGIDEADTAWQSTRPRAQHGAKTWQPGHGSSLDAFLDHGIYQLLKNQGCGGAHAPDAGSLEPRPPQGPSNDDVLYVGVNGKSTNDEIQALRSGAKVEVVSAAGGSKVTRAGITYDLDSDADLKRFVETFGLHPEKADAVIKVLSFVGSRGNLAAIAEVWARAENGGTIPSRMVLSGHSGNGTACGGSLGYVDFRALQKLAEAMPRAARQIEDLQISACSSVENAGMKRDAWIAVLPSLKTIWAYDGSAPSPAGAHMPAWLAATQGRSSTIHLTNDLKAASVAVWSAKGSFEARELPLAESLERAREADHRYQSFVDGSRPVRSHHQSDCETDYRLYRSLSVNPKVGEAERKQLREKADVLLRIRLYDDVRVAFAAAHKSEIDAGYAALRLSRPNLSQLSRAEALEEIRRFGARLAGTSPAPQAARDLAATLKHLEDLDGTIPDPALGGGH